MAADAKLVADHRSPCPALEGERQARGENETRLFDKVDHPETGLLID